MFSAISIAANVLDGTIQLPNKIIIFTQSTSADLRNMVYEINFMYGLLP